MLALIALAPRLWAQESVAAEGFDHFYNLEYDQAIADFNKALSIDPKNAEGYFNRGLVYDNQGKYDKALPDYNKFIELNPNHMSGYINRGILYVKKSLYDKAIDDFDKAIQIAPDDPNYYISRAALKNSFGQDGSADQEKAKELGYVG